MDVLDPCEFLSGGIFREAHFREAIQSYEWKKFQGKPVLIQGCASPIPVWGYLNIMSKLLPHAKSISYGELKFPIPVHGTLGEAHA